MVIASNVQGEAVYFFEQGQVSREMLYSEFEAILDGFVPLPDFANITVKAVYVRINHQLQLTAAVFFLISFDAEGFADKRWNVPLEQLADESARGPDLGAGPIRLACASQCSIAWQQKNLWDPEMSPGANDFAILKSTAKANSIGLRYTEPEPPPELTESQIVEPVGNAFPKLSTPVPLDTSLQQALQHQLEKQYEQKFRDRMAGLLKEQRLRISTLNSRHQQAQQKLQFEHQQRLQEYREALQQQQQAIVDSEQRNQQLQESIAGQAKKIEGLREYFEQKLQSVRDDDVSQLQTLRENYELELQAKLEAGLTELKQELQVKDVELVYRHQNEAAMLQEIERLRGENQALLGNSGDQLLTKLSGAGVSFVAFHPGAGHLTIPIEEMAAYMDNPQAYAADKCGITMAQYCDWLEHYKEPVCRALTSKGDVCGACIDRVSAPVDFHPGENDRCDYHQSSPSPNFALVKN